MTFLEDLGWWGVALVLAIALVALVVLIVATVGGVRQARRAAEAEQAQASDDGDDDEATDATSESTDVTAPDSEEAGSSAGRGPDPETLDPLQTLQLRYARGEIERDEYLQRRADLEGR